MLNLGLCKVIVGYFVFRIRSLGINLNQSCMNNGLDADGTERVCTLDAFDCFACAMYLRMTTK